MLSIRSNARRGVYFSFIIIMALATMMPVSTAALDCATPTAAPLANTQTIVAKAYQDWKQVYLVDAGNGQLRIQRSAIDNYDTVSEGIAYGMLFAAYSNDKPTFDGLWRYAQARVNHNGLMNWRIAADGSTTGYNGATDADEDMAAALIAADSRWGGYKTDAQKLIKLIKQYEVEAGSNVLKPGDMWGGSDVLNPSYLTPSYYTVFGRYMNDSSWNQVKSVSYRVFNNIYSKPDSRMTGFIPDWSKADGSQASGMGYEYGYDGSRAPLRLALASAWDCDPEAKTILQALNKTNQKLDLNNLAQSYHLDGSIANSGDGTPLLAAAATAAMVSDDADFRAASWNALVNTPSRGYFSDSMRLFGLFVASGSFVNPLQLTSATPAAPATAPKTYGMSGTDVQAIASTSMTATASVNVATPVNGAIVDLEVYDARGNRVAQKFYENQNLSTVPASYSVSFTPANSGTYTLRGGIFTRDWSNNIAWNNSVSIINVSAAAPAPLPANPTPVTPAPPVRPANVSIWWPGNSQAVAGVQPFKAVLDGVSLNNYSMYWQVDGGSLNLLNDSNVDAPHKESLVDLSHWNWRSNRQYTINFVAMNNSGVIIGQKATVITVGY